MSFDIRDAEDAIDRLERAVDELRMSLEKLADRFDVIEPRANRTYNFLWARMRDEEE